MIIDACKYWVKEYDIDGYRFDAVWAVNARAPEFGKRLRAELKAIKPGILLLAEDKGRSEEVYEKGFDAAYDWTNDTAWVSQWSWQYKHHAKNSLTVFNHPDISKRKKLLSLSLFTDTKNNFRLLRFLENNDLPRFIMGHSLGQTRMAAEILFSLPGIPLIFSGQETGFRGHPYSGKNTFETGKTIEAQDSLGLFRFYQNIISKRSTHQALKSSEIKEIPVGAPTVIVYSRGSGQDRVIVVANLDSSAAKIALSHKLFPKKTIDLLTGRKIRIQTGKELSVAGYGVLWLSEAKREDLQYLKNQ
jgi:cyclomaltodextrinase